MKALRWIGLDEALLLVAVGLIGYGLWDVWRPGAYLVAGVVLLWIVLPARVPFVVRESRRDR
jgi:hypothetical protein